MTSEKYLKFLVENIHSVVAATTDEQGLPVTCVIDIMYSDEKGLYFLTAKGKSFYKRLIAGGYIAISGMTGKNTMSSAALSVRGNVKDIGSDMLPLLFEENPYMNKIYPTKESMSALTVFMIYNGSGEWFDLSKKPIERESFSFGDIDQADGGYYITEKCIGCGKCLPACPQSCIDIFNSRAAIRQKNCLRCGNCMVSCPNEAVIMK